MLVALIGTVRQPTRGRVQRGARGTAHRIWCVARFVKIRYRGP